MSLVHSDLQVLEIRMLGQGRTVVCAPVHIVEFSEFRLYIQRGLIGTEQRRYVFYKCVNAQTSIPV